MGLFFVFFSFKLNIFYIKFFSSLKSIKEIDKLKKVNAKIRRELKDIYHMNKKLGDTLDKIK